MRPTIKDIARACGVSTATVSLVLNAKDCRISKGTRERVIQTAESMNYHPNKIAASLVSNKTYTIGLIVPDITNLFFSNLANSISAEAAGKGFSTFLCSTEDCPQNDLKCMERMLGAHVDGVILANSGSNAGTSVEQCCEMARSCACPIVFVDRYHPDLSAVSVYTDHEAGGFAATAHLLALGHRKIGCITGYIGLDSAKQRFFGYIRALQEYGIPFDPDLTAEGDYHYESGYRLTDALLDKGVTAVFASNDLMAYGVYYRTKELGLSVPKDLSVVGYDNVVIGTLPLFPLTTIDQNIQDMGTSAVKKLISLIGDPSAEPENVVLKPRLVIRGSTRQL